jgi:DNA polymerase
MNREKALHKISQEIARCPLCKKGGTGKVVPGEGSPDAQVVFIGEAPGKEEAKVGRPFVGRSGKFLWRAIQDIGLRKEEIFITSPGHYLPLRGKPSKEVIIHARYHLFKQLSIIDPAVVVLLGSTACFAVLDRNIEIAREHGTIEYVHGRAHLITFHPAYAMRFPEGKKHFMSDFYKLKKLLCREQT